MCEHDLIKAKLLHDKLRINQRRIHMQQEHTLKLP